MFVAFEKAHACLNVNDDTSGCCDVWLGEVLQLRIWSGRVALAFGRTDHACSWRNLDLKGSPPPLRSKAALTVTDH